MRRYIAAPLCLIFLLGAMPLPGAVYAGGLLPDEEKSAVSERGVWVTCFSKKNVLYSKEAALELIKFCKRAKINQIYLQIYRAGSAYYGSALTENPKYEDAKKAASADVIDLLSAQAKASNIKLFAWINILSLAQNKKADILARYGESVLTRDQYLRPSARSEMANESDGYYLRDDQLFLDPGDPRVVDYIISVVNEIITRYPDLAGVHLDYIRYPMPVPFIPGSRFNKYGLSYGYNKSSIAAFKDKTGLDPLTMNDGGDNFLLWDNWKRQRLTALVRKISDTVKRRSPRLLVSCAVMPSPERAYSVAFQDWMSWLEERLVDYVVIMNYTRDTRLATESARSASACRGPGKVLIGMGAFLMKDDKELFLRQYKALSNLAPDGLVFFSYDDIN